jgi:hypothetical protein
MSTQTESWADIMEASEYIQQNLPFLIIDLTLKNKLKWNESRGSKGSKVYKSKVEMKKVIFDILFIPNRRLHVIDTTGNIDCNYDRVIVSCLTTVFRNKRRSS